MRFRLSVLTAIAVLGALLPGTAGAASGHCSETGDFCYSAMKRDGVVRLYLGTFSFSGRVEICVTAPRRETPDCRSFRLRKPDSHGIHALDVAWSSHFPRRGAGTYRVAFRPTFADEAFAPRVSFRLRG